MKKLLVLMLSLFVMACSTELQQVELVPQAESTKIEVQDLTRAPKPKFENFDCVDNYEIPSEYDIQLIVDKLNGDINETWGDVGYVFTKYDYYRNGVMFAYLPYWYFTDPNTNEYIDYRLVQFEFEIYNSSGELEVEGCTYGRPYATFYYWKPKFKGGQTEDTFTVVFTNPEFADQITQTFQFVYDKNWNKN